MRDRILGTDDLGGDKHRQVSLLLVRGVVLEHSANIGDAAQSRKSLDSLHFDFPQESSHNQSLPILDPDVRIHRSFGRNRSLVVRRTGVPRDFFNSWVDGESDKAGIINATGDLERDANIEILEGDNVLDNRPLGEAIERLNGNRSGNSNFRRFIG